MNPPKSVHKRDRHDAGTAERRHGFGEARVMDVAQLVGRLVVGRRAMRSAAESAPTGCATSVPSAVPAIALIATCANRRRHRLARARQLAVVADPPVRIAQYAAGMIDEAQRLFDVALAITRLRVIFPDQPPQRRAHLLVGGGRRDTQRFVKRGSHLFGRRGKYPALMREYSGKSVRRGKVRRARTAPYRVARALSATFEAPTASPGRACAHEDTGQPCGHPSRCPRAAAAR